MTESVFMEQTTEIRGKWKTLLVGLVYVQVKEINVKSELETDLFTSASKSSASQRNEWFKRINLALCCM